MIISRSVLTEASRSIAATIARQCHNEYHEPVWGDGRLRLAAQQVMFGIEDFLRHNRVEITD